MARVTGISYVLIVGENIIGPFEDKKEAMGYFKSFIGEENLLNDDEYRVDLLESPRSYAIRVLEEAAKIESRQEGPT